MKDDPREKTRSMNRLTLEDRRQIEALVKKGYMQSYIARTIGRNKSTINTELKKYGDLDNYNAVIAHKNHCVNVRRSNQKRTKIFSQDALISIQEKYRKGLSLKAIADELQTSKWVIKNVIKRMNLRKRSLEGTSLDSRVDALEMQLEIIIEQLRELKNGNQKN